MNYKKYVKSYEDSFDGFNSVFSLKENQISSNSDSKSKAYAAAMKALQDKLFELESENSTLKLRFSEIESKKQSEKHQTELQISEEKQKIEKIFKQKINDLESTDKNSQKTIKKLNDIIKLLEVKVKFNEDQVARLNEQNHLDKENFQLELECCKKSLNDAKASEKELKDLLAREKRERNLIKEQVCEQVKVNESLRAEIEFLKEHNKEHRVRVEENFKSIKSELLLKNQENLMLIKQLNMKNKNLQREAIDSKKTGDYYKIQCIKLSQRARESQDAAKDMKKIRSKTKNTNKRSVSSLRISEIPEIESISNDSVGKAITSKEKEIEKLSSRYHKLQSMQFETNEIESLQKNLEEICVSMDKKSKELSELKKKQRDHLKLRLIT